MYIFAMDNGQRVYRGSAFVKRESDNKTIEYNQHVLARNLKEAQEKMLEWLECFLKN